MKIVSALSIIGLWSTFATATNVTSGEANKPFILTFTHVKAPDAQCSSQLRMVQNSIFDTYVDDLLANSAAMALKEAEETVIVALDITRQRELKAVTGGEVAGENDTRDLASCSQAICQDLPIIIKLKGCCRYCGITCSRQLTEEAFQTGNANPSDVESVIEKSDGGRDLAVVTSAEKENERDLASCSQAICQDLPIIIKLKGCCRYCGITCSRQLTEEDPTVRASKHHIRGSMVVAATKKKETINPSIDASPGITGNKATAIALSNNHGYQSVGLFYNNVDKLLDDTDPCKNILNAMTFEMVMFDSFDNIHG